MLRGTFADQGPDARLIQDFLGRRDISYWVRYTKLSPHRLASGRVRWVSASAHEPVLAEWVTAAAS